MKRTKDRMALTPPMGWNSWDCYMSAVTEEELLSNARYQAEKRLPARERDANTSRSQS